METKEQRIILVIAFPVYFVWSIVLQVATEWPLKYTINDYDKKDIITNILLAFGHSLLALCVFLVIVLIVAFIYNFIIGKEEVEE